MNSAARNAVIALLASWKKWPEEEAWYLTNFLPRVVTDLTAAARSQTERELLDEVHERLSRSEWAQLPSLVRDVGRQDGALIRRTRAEQQASVEAERQRWKDEKSVAHRQRAAVTQPKSNGRTTREQWIDEQEAAARVERLRANQERERDRLEERRQRLFVEPILVGLRAAFARDFLTAKEWLQANDPDGQVDEATFRAAAAEHVAAWCRTNLPTDLRFDPSPEQLAVIAEVDDHALVAARAGSGKTATMVARAIFLVRGCGVPAGSILMLAFNKDAANEIRERLTRAIGESELPNVMTFHALAHRLVRPAENLVADFSDTAKPLSTIVQSVIDRHLKNPVDRFRIRDVMMNYFRRDWDQIVRRGDDRSTSEQMAYRRSLPQESMRGEFVKSFGEKLIANTLFEHGLDYGYEHDVRWNGFNYKPDFTIFVDGSRKVIVEYFGMAGNPEYDEQTKQKAEFWKSRPEKLLSYEPADVRDPGFTDRLVADLAAEGLDLRRLTDDEMWERVKKRALDRFTGVVTTAISRSRQRRWSGGDLIDAWNELGVDDKHIKRFVKVVAQIIDEYGDELVVTNSEDFTGLIWRATAAIESGAREFGAAGRVVGDLREIRFVVIDEFQDFSEMFFELLTAVLRVADDAKVMAVGDDWQAINEFAGSSTVYFETFADRFENATMLRIDTNRRSSWEIVKLGNLLMRGIGEPAKTLPSAQRSGAETAVREFDTENFMPSLIELERFGENRRTPALLRLIMDHRRRGRSIAVLSRRRNSHETVTIDGKSHSFKTFDEYGDFLRSLLGGDRGPTLRFSSVHGFKGQEADAVILLGVSDRAYPLLHPTWPLFQAFGDTVSSLTAAEQRLFYVGISRAAKFLDVVTDSLRPSPFWGSIDFDSAVRSVSWHEIPDFRLSEGDDRIEVRVYNRNVDELGESRALLNRSGFAFCAAGFWRRLVDRSDFTEERMRRAPWAKAAGVRVEAWDGGGCVVRHDVPGGRPRTSEPAF